VAENLVARNEAPSPAAIQPPQPAEPSQAARPTSVAGAAARMRGYLMEEQTRSRQTDYTPASVAGSNRWAAAGVTLPVLAALVAWRLRRRNRR